MKRTEARRFFKRGTGLMVWLAWMLLITCTVPAALTTAPGNSPDGPPAPPEIHDVRPPDDVFPYPAWMVVAAACLAVLIIVFATVWIVRWMNSKPPAPSMSPREVALKELRALQNRVEDMEPYAFSIAVSEVLRRFIGRHFGLHALRQTTPEFLAAASISPKFSEADRGLLAGFLEKCDMIKFARIDATTAESGMLLESAMAFAKGARG